MPTTNRTFLGSFFAAFRAHSAATKPSSPTSTSSLTNTTSSSAFSAQALPAASTRTIATKASSSQNQPQPQQTISPGATTAAVQAANQHLRQASTSSQPQSSLPTYTQPSSLGGRHHHTSQSPASPTRSPAAWQRARRGSDSSSDSGGFREVLGAEKWYVGGRTAGGEEKFLALGMVRKERSWERRSADQLSL